MKYMIDKRKCQAEFISKATRIHGDKFDYSLIDYVNNRTPIKVRCNMCQHIFWPIPFNLFKIKNCPVCAITSQRKSSDEFISSAKSIHGDNYDYSMTIYINAKTKVNIKCRKCNQIFSQLPRGHLYEKQGCPNCRQSHGEEKIRLLLKVLNIPFYHEYKFKKCIGTGGNPLRFDFYLPDHNLCIEFDGKQHFDKKSKFWSPEVEKNDLIKTEFCKQKGLRLHRIHYTKINHVEDLLRGELLT